MQFVRKEYVRKRQITPQLVRESANKCGLKLIKRGWGDGKTCGCPILCILVADNLNRPVNIVARCGHISAAFDDFGDYYVVGFLAAVDDCPQSDIANTDEFEAGYEDGLAVSRELFTELQSAPPAAAVGV